MKLRFHANTLRLRLSQSEVARLAETGCVEATVTFAPGIPGQIGVSPPNA
jgi:hypothetical protein